MLTEKQIQDIAMSLGTAIKATQGEVSDLALAQVIHILKAINEFDSGSGSKKEAFQVCLRIYGAGKYIEDESLKRGEERGFEQGIIAGNDLLDGLKG